MKTHPTDASIAAGPKGSAVASSGKGQRSDVANQRLVESPSTDHQGAKQIRIDGVPIPGAESVGSFLRRLGSPPPDVEEHLVQQFRLTCEAQIADGKTIPDVNLERWYITHQGQLGVLDSVHTSNQLALDADTLTTRFRERLNVPQTGSARRRGRDRSAGRAVGPARRFEKHSVEVTESSHLTLAEQLKREDLIQKFTASLVGRFGPQSIVHPVELPSKSRKVKPQKSIQRRQHFNWNLVLGVGAAVAVVAMVVTGVQVTKIRQRRADNAPRPAKIIVVETESVPNDISQAESSETVREPEVDPIEIAPLADSARQTTASPRGSEDVLDELQSFLSGEIEREPAANLRTPTKVTMKTSELLALRLPKDISLEMKPESQSTAGRDSESAETSPADSIDAGTLESVAKDEDSRDGNPESEQQIRAAKMRFARLPSVGQTDHVVSVAESGISIRRIEFPIPVPIALSNSADKDSAILVNEKTGNAVASLTRDAEITQFRWNANAKQEKPSAQLVHGRLIDDQEGSIFLRPAIETDAFRLSMDPRQMHPSWKLDSPVLTNVSRLELDLSVPESMDLAWATPFNPSRPSGGRAIAILTPEDGETVAIGVILDVKCKSTLKCRIRYAARLAPSMPWYAFSAAGFDRAGRQVAQNISSLEARRVQSQRAYEEANSMNRRLM